MAMELLSSVRVTAYRNRCRRRVQPACATRADHEPRRDAPADSVKVSGSSRYSPAHGRRLALAATGAAGALAALSAFPTRALAFLGDENLIVIKMGDEKGRLVFVPDYVKLEKDTMYRLRVVNDSDIYHNWVAQDFLLKGAYWVPLRIEESTGECEFIIVPKEVGTWPYVCTVLGHKKMKGVIEVVEKERKY